MKRSALLLLVAALFPGSRVFAQSTLAGQAVVGDAALPGDLVPAVNPPPSPAVPRVRPILSPELALVTYERQAAAQASELRSYSAVTVIRAQLPETAQEGEYELERSYSAPHTLLFRPIRFVGDKFVKSNVIIRLLQSEVDHVEKDDPAQTAISPANYKFSYKGQTEVGDRAVHVFHVRPRQKRQGLFKGRIYLDARTGAMARVEGSLVKSPSFFVKNIQFTQDYAEFDSFTLPVHVHSEARARMLGRTIVDMTHRDYQPVSVALAITPGR